MALFELQDQSGKTFEVEAPDQAAAVSAFKKFTQPTVAQDIKAGAPSWLASGVTSALFPAEGLMNLAGSGLNWAANKVGLRHPMEGNPNLPAVVEQSKQNAANLDKIGAVSSPSELVQKIIPKYEPRTRVGEYVRTATEFLPSAATMGASSLREIPKAAATLGLLPAFTSESAGQLTKGSNLEGVARGVGAFGGGVAGAVLNRPTSAVQTIGKDLGGLTDSQLRPIVQQAENLMADAANRGINLSWAQAIEQVAPGATNLPKLQRYIERTQEGANTLKPFYQGQPQAMQTAVEDVATSIAPRSANPSAIGPTASQEAQTVLRDVENAINRHTRDLYASASTQQIPSATYAAISQNTSYQNALRQIRNNPELNAQIANLPDDATAVVDLVRRQLQAAAETANTSPNPNDRLLGALRGSAGGLAEDAASRNVPTYAQAQAEQAALRQQYLNPLQQGPLGGVARADSTQGTINAVLPRVPQAGSEQEVATAIQALGRSNPTIPADIVAQHIRNTASQQMKQNPGGENYYGGARFASEIAGSPQTEANLLAATRSLAQGNTRADELARVLEALRATGKRLPEGAQTSTDLLKDQAMRSSFDLRMTPQRAVDFGRDIYQTWRVQKAAEETAKLLSDPKAAELLLQASRFNASNPLAAILMNTAQTTQ